MADFLKIPEKNVSFPVKQTFTITLKIEFLSQPSLLLHTSVTF